jgi:predicted enzyme related to lactoylglutathione lyase
MTTTIDKAAIHGIDIAACFVSDPARSIAFYRDVLGLQPTEIDDKGRGAEFTLADGQTFGVWNPGEDGPKSGSVIMFAVGDIKAAVERIRSNGGTVSDPDETPVCFMSFGSDVDGNAFMIHQRKG